MRLSLEQRAEQRERIATRLVAAFASVPEPQRPSFIINVSIDIANGLVDALERAADDDFEKRYS